MYENQKKYKQKHAIHGLCVDCSKPAKPGCIRCEEHLKKSNERVKLIHEKWRKENRCVRCGKPLDSESDSEKCCINCNISHSQLYGRSLFNGINKWICKS